MMYQNDTKYVGEFKLGVPHGKGIYYWREGQALAGEFANGKLREGGHYIYPDGSIIIQAKKRGWHETYLEEDKAARQRYIQDHKYEILMEGALEALSRDFEAERQAKEERCGEQIHSYLSQEWIYCGH